MSELLAKPHKWEKLGLIARPQSEKWWWRSHAMIPTPQILDEHRVRLYFSGRNDLNQSHIGWIIVDLREPTRVVETSAEPVLAPGALGCFDDNGVTPSCIVADGSETLLYYIGWNPGSTVRMHLFGGLAVSLDGGLSFERWSEAPIIERCRVNPYLNTAPFVLKEQNLWRMYYVGGAGWRHKDLPRYNIQYAESKDGRNWNRRGHVAIPFASDEENALARPYVIKDGDVYKMWFSAKGAKYRMAYAESLDGKTWVRDDACGGLGVTPGAFDSDMVEYFAVVQSGGRKYMFYNGNGYGIDGVGVAVEV
jgi:predicted GH43/DUF377 family glycosyl hydrolase